MKERVFQLKLTEVELAHLRDVCSVLLHPHMESVSQVLAGLSLRVEEEAKLWKKICDMCAVAKISLDEEAPDFIVAVSGPPPMTVVKLASKVEQKNKQEQKQTKKKMTQTTSKLAK